ncbi:MAG: phage tail tube protein [bacterium]|nr:phage tail tube protein [bacterium]
MDSANKQSAVIAEVTMGTTPATPAFKLLRDIRVSGAPQRSASRSPERRSDRTAANMTSGLSTFPKSIELPFVRDAASDILLESVMCGAWATNVLKNASTKMPFTLEEKYEGGATDPYRRLAGCLADSLSLSFRNGEPGQMSFGIRAMAETAATTAIASSTYAAPTPGYDPVTPADITVNGLFGLSTPKVMGLNMSITNSMRDQHSWGSNAPFGLGLGLFNIEGSVQIYFSAAADYSTFMTRQTSLSLDLTMGSVANYKDQIVLGNCDVWNPDVDDPGATGDHMVTLNFMARYSSGSTSAITWTRLVA